MRSSAAAVNMARQRLELPPAPHGCTKHRSGRAGAADRIRVVIVAVAAPDQSHAAVARRRDMLFEQSRQVRNARWFAQPGEREQGT
jgi:hypothetical protein